MSDEHQVARPLLDNESLPPVKTIDLLMPTYCHVPFYYQSAVARRSILQRQGMRRGETKCPQKHDMIVRMISEGRSRAEIAAEVGATAQTVKQYMWSHDLQEKEKPYMATARERLEEIRALWKQGITQKEIAKRLGINRWSVCEIMSGRGKRNR